MAEYVPTSCRLSWPYDSTVSLPTDWSEDTALSDKFLWGAANGANGTGTGGSTSHGHTATQHSHGGGTHQHDLTITGSTVGTTTIVYNKTGLYTASSFAHTHPTAYTAATEDNTQNTTPTASSATNDPSHMLVRWIYPDDSSQEIPGTSGTPNRGAMVFVDGKAAPTNFTIADGTGDTVDADGMLLKGSATGGGSGATGAGTTHGSDAQHGHTDSGHQHTLNHDHPDSDFGYSSQGTGTNSGATTPKYASPGAHHYAYNIGNDSQTVGSGVQLWDDADSYGAQRKLLIVQNVSGSDQSVQTGMVFPFRGNLVDIPDGYELCDGSNGTYDMRDRAARTSLAVGVGDPLGQNEHEHEKGADHYHSIASHGHSFLLGNYGGNYKAAGITMVASETHTHADGASLANASGNTADGGAGLQSSDIRPEYANVLWIKKVNPVTVYLKGGNVKGANIAA